MATASKARALPSGARGWAATALIAEDEVLIRVAIVDCLEDRGFSVVEVGNASAAIQFIVHSGVPIDIVFSDICMPGEPDGLGLARWLRQNRPGLPIMLTSGLRKQDAMVEVEAGAIFFEKPYDCELVADKIYETVMANRKHVETAVRN